MGTYALSMLAMASMLHRAGRPTTDLIVKFLEQFALICDAMHSQDLWDEEDGFFYDRLRHPDGSSQSVKVRSIVGILPLLAVAVVDDPIVERVEGVHKRAAAFVDARRDEITRLKEEGVLPHDVGEGRLLLGVVDLERVLRLFDRLFDEDSFLSPYGVRAVSRSHAAHPFAIEIDGNVSSIDYEPAESTTGMFGGNSNWRGPIWMPVNYLIVNAISRYGRFLGSDYTREYPTGSGNRLTLDEIAGDLSNRLVSLFLRGADGRRPCFGWVERLQNDPAWKDNILFYEYFHGDNGAGLGASHQTGWTGIVADLILRRRGEHVATLGELLEETGRL
jgi:hypothetical protein